MKLGIDNARRFAVVDLLSSVRKGDRASGLFTGFMLDVREVKPPRPLAKEDIIRLRQKLRVSQAAFALLLNTSAATVRAWEQGVNTPSGSTLRLLAIARKDPKALFTV